MRARRVLLFPSAYAPAVGGVEELTARLAHRLQDRGTAIEVWTNRWPPSLPADEVVDGVAVRRHHLPMPVASGRGMARFGLGLPRAVSGLIRAARRFDPDVIHVQCFSSNGIYASLLSRALHVPLVVSLQGETVMDDADVYEHSAALRAGLRAGLRRADAVTGCSAYVIDDAVARFGLEPDRGLIVPNGVDTEPAVALEAIDLPFDRYILGIGRFVPKKGFDLLLEAFRIVADTHPGVGLVIAGDGRARSTVAERVTALGLRERVVLPGVLGRGPVAGAMSGAAVFVLPSRVEPFGIVVLEALRAGTPTVVSVHGGAGEIVRDGLDGLHADPQDAPALARQIGRILDDAELAARLGRAGPERAREFSWERLAGVYSSIYDDVLRR